MTLIGNHIFTAINPFLLLTQTVSDNPISINNYLEIFFLKVLNLLTTHIFFIPIT